MIVILCALLSAVLYGTGAALEQYQAAAAPDSAAGRPRLLALLARRPAWLLGITAQIGGFAAHAVALRGGSLTVVQMLVAAELVVSVGIIRVRSGRPLPRSAWAAGAAVVAGIAGFLALTAHGPAAAGEGARLAGHAAALGAAASAVAAAVLAVAGLSTAPGRTRALLLAAAAGLADACAAVVTMALARTAGHGPGHGLGAVLGSWPLYALVAAGLGSVLLTQTAYQAARPLVSLPVIAAVNPMASVAIGLDFLGDTGRLGAGRTIGAGLVALATAAALVVLARRTPDGHRPAAARPSASRPSAARPAAARPALAGGAGLPRGRFRRAVVPPWQS